MSIPLRVLVLEDSEADYELLLHELKHGGFEPESARVQTAADLRTALAAKTWDMIISDYTMPQFNALDALKIVRESGLDLPFIIISGAIGEDVAVNAMKAGAHDYLMKGNLARLCPAVRRELGEAEVRRQRRRDEDELRLLNRLYDLLSECNQALVRAQSRDKFLQDICRIAVDIGGFQLAWIGWPDPETRRLKPAVWAGKPGVTLEWFRPSAEGDLRDFAESAVLEGKPSIYSELLAEPRRPSARPTAAETGPYVSAAFPLRQAGKVGGALCLYANESDVFQEKETALLEEVAMDIAFGLDRLEGEARRKQAEQELQFQNILLTTQQETSLDGILVVDDKARILSWNRRFMEMWKIPPEVMDSESVNSALQASLGLLLEPEKFMEKVTWLFLHPSERGQDEIALKDGRLFERYSAPMIGPDGRSLGRVLYYRDITERKRAEEAVRRAAEEWSKTFDSMPDLVMLIDPQNRIVRANQALGKALGTTAETLIGRHCYQCVHGAEQPIPNCPHARSVAEGKEAREELFEPTLDRHYLVTTTPLFDDGQLTGSVHVMHDITERKRADRELQEQEERFRTLFEQAADCIILLEIPPDGIPIIRDANLSTSRILGYGLAELIGQPVSMLIANPNQMEPFQERRRKILSGETTVFEDTHRCKDGSVRIFECSVKEFHLGSKLFAISAERDITERKRVEEAIRESEEQFRTLFESSRDAIMMLDQRGFTDCNQATLELFGYSSREEFITKHPDLSPPTQADGSDSFAAAQERIQTALKRGSLFFPWIYKRSDGTPFPAEVLLSQYYLKGEAKLQAVVRDITESVKIKEGLLKAAEEWRTTFDTIPDPIMLTDLEHRILRVNRAFIQAVGRTFKEILGQRFYQVIDSQDHWPEYYPQPQTVAERKDHTVEIYHPIFGRFYSVTITPLLDHAGALAGWVHLLHDITERKQMEMQSLETEKLASLGVMAGGVAHEINNPLGGILGIAQLLLMDYPDRGALTEDLKNIEGAALHCAEIVKNLLTFSRKSGASTREPVEVPELVNQVLKLIGHQFIYYNILVRQEFEPDFPGLMLNRTQFQQVLINLLINAQQAMSKKGEVVIRGRTLPTREPVLEIEDQGGGIPAAIRDRIFDPFFTTKEAGKGTGLGLSVSYRIVQAHGGRIEVESKEGKGTRMRLVFPPELVTTEKSESRREP